MNPRTLHLLLALAVALLVSLIGAPSHAQPAPSPPAAGDQANAARLFQRGKTLYRQGKYTEAYEAYKAAWRLQQTYDIAANLGNVELKLGKHADGATHLDFALESLPPSLSPREREQAEQKLRKRLDDALEFVGALQFVVTPDGTEVIVDGQSVGKTPLPGKTYLARGKHVIEARADGHHPLTHEVVVGAGSSETIRMNLVPRAAAAPSEGPVPVRPPEADTGPSLPIIIAGAAVGAVAVGTGIGLVVAAGSAQSDREELIDQLGDIGACRDAPAGPCQEIEDLSAEENTLRGVGIAALIGGGVVLAGTALYALWPRGDGDEAAADAARLVVLPQAAPAGGGLSLVGSF